MNVELVLSNDQRFLYHRPICRNVLDAVYVLDAIVGFDPRDSEATKEASKFIPVGGYKQFLNEDGLTGKRLGVVRKSIFWLLQWIHGYFSL